MRSAQKKNQQQSKRVILAEKFDLMNRNELINQYHCEITKTFNYKQKECKKISDPIINLEDEKEQQIIKEINELKLEYSNLEKIMLKNDELHQLGLMGKMFEIENGQLDFLTNSVAQKNRMMGELRNIDYENNQHIENIEVNQLIKQLNEQVKEMGNEILRLNQDINNQLIEKELIQNSETILNQELDQLKQEENNFSIQSYEQSRALKQKQLSVQIIQEQFYSLKKQIRCCLLFNCQKMEYDQNYEPYVKVKNSKQISFEHKDSLLEGNLWSESKSKQKKFYQYRPNVIRFDCIHQRKENNNQQYEQFFNGIELFLKGSLYKQICWIHKNLSFNSVEYQLIYNQELNDQIEKVKKLCDKEGRESQQNLIVYLGDKDRGFLFRFITDICKLLNNFNNNVIEVDKITIQMTQFYIKDPNIMDIFECSYEQLEQNRNVIEEQKLFIEGQYHVKLEIQVNKIIKRQIHILLLNPSQIDNSELFCKQFKSTFKKEKGFKETLGNKVEQILKLCDKCLIVVQIPEMIKINGKQTQKLQKIKNIIEFSQQLVIKKSI